MDTKTYMAMRRIVQRERRDYKRLRSLGWSMLEAERAVYVCDCILQQMEWWLDEQKPAPKPTKKKRSRK